ncbi:MAG: XamI family restriction endonuclease [Okeania sp. SIO3H1]|uniref:XamI family restriction endonuclease n=1 Tax=Okeania sp. SIO1I7 TaxID=2607772 RepID=UPI0013C6AD97|nr:XamI family restriction endonuclease [Okeania sp. SIO1I7]NEN90678.1 XamI family restriction endonuclease [Okeania sp. SIO3H1]NET28385.1 XamI family restriction endonuclease [Okeania sp. SIO1I7]
MPVNADKPHLWKKDITQSVDFYNNWFLEFAPITYKETRLSTTQQVESTLILTANFTNISREVLYQHPFILPILRMATAPPIARDRLIGLADVRPNLVKNMEEKLRIPPRMNPEEINSELDKICLIIIRLLDKDIFPWLESDRQPTDIEVSRAATIVADRLCGNVADPIIRNAQEQRQLSTIRNWLENRGYSYIETGSGLQFNQLNPGSFSFRMNISVKQPKGSKQINIPIDTIIMPFNSQVGELPLLIEAKSAGDYTNTNKRRKEEAMKINQLRNTYGKSINFVLFLCGYFDSGYLGYEAAEGIDWIWEHRIDDLALFGV